MGGRTFSVADEIDIVTIVPVVDEFGTVEC
jgi:hypothetical protein